MQRKAVRRALLVLGGGLLVCFVCLVWAAVASIRTRSDVLAARTTLAQLASADQPLSSLPAALETAHTRLRDGSDRMNTPGPWVAARLPLIGRSFVAVRDTAAAAEAVVGAASTVVASTNTEALMIGGGLDLAALDRLETALTAAADRTAGPLRRLRAARTGFTPRQVRAGLADARRELGGVDVTLRNTAGVVHALGTLAGRDGPQRLLFVLENNAELRGTGGFISTFAEATSDGGRFTINEFRDVEGVAQSPEKARKVPAPPEFVALYGRYLADTTLWKNANMSPHGPSSLSVLANVAAATLGQRPDAVIALDVPAIAEILRATGSVELPDGRVIDADNVIEELLVKAYQVPDGDAQHERRRVLRVAATAVIRQLLTGAPPSLSLMRAMQRAASGRHLMAWAADQQAQASFAAAGVDGAIPKPDPDIAMMTLHNLGATEKFAGNKLDHYSSRELDVHVVIDGDRATTTQRWTLRNESPSGLPEYVAGGTNPGRTRNQVRFSIPVDAESPSYARDETALAPQQDVEAGHRVLSDVVTLDPGQTVTWTLSYTVPLKGESYRISLVPQPLSKSAKLRLRVEAGDGELRPLGKTPAQFEDSWIATIHAGFSKPSPSVAERVKRWWRQPVRVG